MMFLKTIRLETVLSRRRITHPVGFPSSQTKINKNLESQETNFKEIQSYFISVEGLVKDQAVPHEDAKFLSPRKYDPA